MYSKKQSMSNNYLPQEILQEIFLRLPPKSVGKFRCVSTLWNAQFSAPQFITLYQSHQPYQQTVIIRSRSGNLYKIVLPTKNDYLIWLPIPVLTGVTCLRLLGSSNGLVLLEEMETSNLIVVNPVTRKQVLIPNPPSVSREDNVIAYGFGYDRLSGDYKVVALSYQYFNKRSTNVEVYCMKTRVWRIIVYPFGESRCSWIMPLVNGALHWYTSLMGSKTCDRIVAFDLGTESFSEVPLPKENFHGFSYGGLDVLGECLVNITNFDNGSTGVCMMNEYGNGDSWVRFYIPKNYNWSPVKPLCLVGDEKMLCTAGKDMQCWAVCDLDSEKGKVQFSGCGQNLVSFTDSMVIEESLVSPE